MTGLHFRRLLTIISALAGAAAFAPAAQAQNAAPTLRMVIELFTSQGCSSCPPADAVLADLARDPDVIALTLPVDYWDYLGWKDTLAQAAHTQRQKAYSYVRGDRQVYTPQAVIDGVAHAIGSKRGQIERIAVSSRGVAGALTVPVSISRRDKDWVVEVGGASNPSTAQIVVMNVLKSSEVAIGRGENANRTITYVNVVRSMATLGEWTGAQRSLTIDPAIAPIEGADGFVVLLQATAAHGKPGAILGAAKSPGL